MSHSHYNSLESDPDLEYHQYYKAGPPGRDDIWAYFTRPGFIIAVLLFLSTIIYQILFLVGCDLFSLPELIWNWLVYITPSRLLDTAEMYTNPLRISGPAIRLLRTHAAKSEAMRKIFGLDTAGSIIGSVAQAGRRRMSTLSGVKHAAEAAEDSPPGLGNWDNSCYQNSVLQGLASLDSLSGYLGNPHIENEVASKPEMRMANALQGLIATLNDPANNGSTKWTPTTLKSMSSWQQQDAQEYFSKVLDEVDKEIRKAASVMRKLRGFESGELSSSNLTSSESLKNSTFRNPLEGMVAQRVGCTSCHYSEGLSMIPFNCLTVPLGRYREYDVTECLDEYTKLEAIEGVECGKCTLLKAQRLLPKLLERMPDEGPGKNQVLERMRAVEEALEDDDYEDKSLTQKCKITSNNRVSSTKTRQAVVARPPKSLVIHFNRSQFNEMTGDLTKNCAMVKFPKVLDLGPWCLGSSGTTADSTTEEWLLQPDQSMIASSRTSSRIWGPMYELRAVVTHYGRHENGHYICYKKHPGLATGDGDLAKEQWWRLSDEDVTRVSEECVLDQGGVFMLFYDLTAPAFAASAPAPVLDLATDHETESAAKTPLPDNESLSDTQLSDPEVPSPVAAQQEGSMTSTSEVDEVESVEGPQQHYTPTKAIFVPSYPHGDVHSKEENAGQRTMSQGSLVMV
jgi:ubiquitin carboxyl-terminal hydrolase 1